MSIFMAKQVRPLTDTKCASLKPKDKEYVEADGGGLYLRVRPTGQKVGFLDTQIGEMIKEKIKLH